MIRSRRLAFAAAAVLLGLSACGDASSHTTSAKAPVVIHLGAGGSGAGREGTKLSPTADRMMMPFQDITYVFDGTAPDLGTTGMAWTLPAGAKPDPAQIARIATALGVEGEVRELPADQGGGWMVGAADYSTATITVSADGLLSWWFNAAPTMSAEAPCTVGGSGGGVAIEGDSVGVINAVPPASDAAPGSEPAAPVDTIAVDTPLPVDTVPIDMPVCPEPQPPANVPDSAAAETAAKAFFASLGLDPANYDYETYADEWGANVTAYLLLGGHRSPLTLSVGFGAEGAITWASGFLATPVEAGEYPLTGVDTGITRLNDESGKWMFYGYGGGVQPMAKAMPDIAVSTNSASPAVGAPAPDAPVTPETSTGTVTVDSGVAVDPMPIMPPPCDASSDCVPGDTMVPPEPITIHLTDVALGTVEVWDADGTVWLLPAYNFQAADDGGMYSIIAVDDSFLDLPDETPIPVDTMPVESVPVDSTVVTDGTAPVDTVVGDQGATIDPAAAAAALVGLTVDEATTAAEAEGWTLRVSTLDGEPQAVTADYQPNRVNVSVVQGIVTAIDNIG